MNFMDIPDISFVDMDELGFRPLNWTDDDNENECDDTTNGSFDKEKRTGFQFITNGDKFISNEGDALIPDDDDDSNYEIDPETGEKIFSEVPAASSLSLLSPPPNDKWIEAYLSDIESSSISPNQLIPTKTTNSEFFFEHIPFSDDPINSNWFSNYISPDERTDHMMFPDQSGQFIDVSNKMNPPQTTAPIYIPLTNKNHQDAFMNLLSVSIDDEYSVDSNSTSSRRQRLLSSFESDSTTRDSELTFDGSFVETKLEKMEHDEHSDSHLFLRRSSTRSSYQGQQDEDTLRRYNIPLALYAITESSTEEYNRHLAHLTHLNPEQIHIIKDIRRRGKNKVAAQNCRKRKAISVERLHREVDELKRVKHDLEQRRKSCQQQINETRYQYEYLHRQVLPDRQLPPAITVK